jgi:UDP-N-acetylglucosamine 2-epimerase
MTVPWQLDKITAAWRKAMTQEFTETLIESTHPYGTGGAAKIIANVLAKIKLDNTLTIKHFNNIVE